MKLKKFATLTGYVRPAAFSRGFLRTRRILRRLPRTAHSGLMGTGHLGGVQADLRHAQARRAAGAGRARRSTTVAAAAALLATGILSVAAAASTHSKRVVTHVVRVKR